MGALNPTPLAGLTVVDATVDRAGSIAGMLLADLGARVTRIETADGLHRRPDPRRFADPVCWDRGKRRRVLTTLDPSTDPALDALLDDAAVLLQDAPPDRFETSALHPGRLTAGRDRLATVWLPPYGAAGDRYASLTCDPLLQAAVTAYAMHQPAFDPDVPIAPVVDAIGAIQGSLAASAAVVSALDVERGNRGQLATVSGVDAAGALLATLVNRSLDAEDVIRTGRNPRLGPSFRPFRCGDGEMLFLATLVAPLFIKALDVLDALEVMTLDGVDGEYLNLFRPEVGPRAAAIVEKRFASQPRQHWLERFEAEGVPAEPVLSRDAWRNSEHFAATGGCTEFVHPEVGPVRTPATPVRLVERASGIDPARVWPGRPGGSPGPGPLAGLRVLDVATFLAGPYGPTVLAHWGADVVKVETGEGDPYRAYSVSYLAVNQAKRSVRLDLAGDGRSVLESLIATADVFVDNLRPSTRERLDFDADTLTRLNPGLIHATVTAFGPGPFAERPGFDPCIQALSGMMHATGSADEPLNTTTPVHDVAAGTSLTLGVAAALWQRARSGTVLGVTTSLAAGSSLLQCAELTDFDGRPEPDHGGIDFTGPSPSRRFYRATDGWVGVAAPSPSVVLAALVDDAPADSPRPEARIEAAIATRPTSEVLSLLHAASVPAAAAVGPTWDTDPYLDANALSHVVVEPTFGRCRVMRGPGSWSRSGVAVRTRMADAGSDTTAVATNGWDAPDT